MYKMGRNPPEGPSQAPFSSAAQRWPADSAVRCEHIPQSAARSGLKKWGVEDRCQQTPYPFSVVVAGSAGWELDHFFTEIYEQKKIWGLGWGSGTANNSRSAQPTGPGPDLSQNRSLPVPKPAGNPTPTRGSGSHGSAYSLSWERHSTHAQESQKLWAM